MNRQTIPTIPATGFLRLNDVLKFIPVKRTRWYEGVKTGEFPHPVALGPRIKAYRAEDIRAVIERLGSQTAEGVK
jgi:predicted DNA-binding transcriptional regulator AlpA